MHIVAFNSSPRDSRSSKTQRLLTHFIQGAGRAGATTEIVHLRRYRIEPCLGCFSCWKNTPGVCLQPDDMTKHLFSKFVEADIAILATPLYYFTMNACMKSFIDRTLPMFDPLAAPDASGHPGLRFGRMPRLVVLSVCAACEQNTFSLLSQYMQTVFTPFLAAEIYRHSSESMDIPNFQPQVEVILQAAAQAGAEFVRTGRIQEATMQALTQDLAPPEVLQQMSKKFWQQDAAS